MIWIFVVLSIAVAVVIVAPRLNQISDEQLMSLRKQGAVLIDVRTPGEFQQGAVDGAVNIPVGNEADAIKEHQLDTRKPVLLYCASGMRSSMAKGTYRKLGFSEVHNLGGYKQAEARFKAD